MSTALILTTLLLASALAQDQILGQSGDGSPEVSTTGSSDASLLPDGTTTNIVPSGFRPQSLSLSIGSTGSVAAPADWSFLSQSPAGGSSKWIYPDGAFKILPRFWISTYTITFHTDCPQNGVTLAFATTGLGFVQLNGNWVHTWASSWPTIHKISLKKPQLQCGCNTIKILVYNFYYPSPAALFYSLSQDVSGCYNCTNLGVSFYNKETCQCECASECACKNPLMSWYNYPTCGCMCSQEQKCEPNQYFNRQQCKCACQPKCCPNNQFQDPKTCQCRPKCLPFAPCKPGYEWDFSKCDCVPICKNVPLSCPGKQDWDFVDCVCRCSQQARCISPWTWNPESCQCECGIICIATMRVDLERCMCVPLYFASNLQGTSGNQSGGQGIILDSTVSSSSGGG